MIFIWLSFCASVSARFSSSHCRLLKESSDQRKRRCECHEYNSLLSRVVGRGRVLQDAFGFGIRTRHGGLVRGRSRRPGHDFGRHGCSDGSSSINRWMTRGRMWGEGTFQCRAFVVMWVSVRSQGQVEAGVFIRLEIGDLPEAQGARTRTTLHYVTCMGWAPNSDFKQLFCFLQSIAR